MSRFFDDLESDLVRAAAARARPGRRPFAAFSLTTALALGVAGTAAGGTYFALRNSSIAPFAASDVTPEQRVAPGTSAIAALRAADPERGQPSWTLRVARSDTGLQCSTVGQVKDGAFGLVGLDGAFRNVPEANADACGEPGTLLGTRIFAAKRSRDVRTVVNGVAGPDLERVTVEVAGRRTSVSFSPEGAFVYVLRGYPEDAQPVVTLRRRGGTERRYTFGAGGYTVRDPYGGRAWKLASFGIGTRPTPKAPRLTKGCVNFASARAVPGEPNVSSPPVCGWQPGRLGVKLKPLYFTTRRLSGRASGRSFLAGNWNGHPPRVAVWGSAREVKRIVVRAGRFAQVTAPKLNGAFLVFLPSGTDPRDVTVEIDGKRHGSSFGTVEPPEVS